MARRVYADSIAIIFAAREPAPHPGVLDGLPELRIDGLPEADARELLASAAGRLDLLAAGRIVAETGGNPLALIEIGQEIAAGQLASDPPLPEPLPTGRQLEQRYLREVWGLQDETSPCCSPRPPTRPGIPLAVARWRGSRLHGRSGGRR